MKALFRNEPDLLERLLAEEDPAALERITREQLPSVELANAMLLKVRLQHRTR
ncbi:hypothetical protein [Mesorhizobium sp. M2D.F.Ca.ET.223.01.1.1]|uniref:hypothetical protein n=1 Tax=Mesorhizobium sp. M2D.F.Ca.ET.223.01.1.1 TaxID=2563940 RepID=UPI00142F24F1|nr:hypothetical protein [Mesorhizobium sp. M2D.F.Ca.ET.223.01.1.1]